MSNEIITKDNEQIKNFFSSIEQMLDSIEHLTMNYRPLLNGERYLTDAEVSEELKISRRTLQDYRTDGKIPYVHLGGKILYRESDIQKMLEKGYCNAWE